MDTAFKHKVSKAVAHMKKILGAHRNFVFPAGSMEHTYDDKFALAEASTKVALVSVGNCLDTSFQGNFWPNLWQMNQWVEDGRTVTLKLHVVDTCTFVETKEYVVFFFFLISSLSPSLSLSHTHTHTHTHTTSFSHTKRSYEVQSTSKQVTEKKGFFGNVTRRESYVQKRVVEDFWCYETTWRFLVYCGDEPDHNIKMVSGSGKIIKGTKRPPMHFNLEHAVAPPKPPKSITNEEIDLTWYVFIILIHSLSHTPLFYLSLSLHSS